MLVRRALAVTLRNSPKLPRDIAIKLAKDIDAIAVPDPQELARDHRRRPCRDRARRLVRKQQVAIAQRPTLGEGLTEVIALYGSKPAVEAAVAQRRRRLLRRRLCRRDQALRQRQRHQGRAGLALLAADARHREAGEHGHRRTLRPPRQQARTAAATRHRDRLRRPRARHARSRRAGRPLHRSGALRPAAAPQRPPHALADHARAVPRPCRLRRVRHEQNSAAFRAPRPG